MSKQPFYALDFFGDANFWTQGEASTRSVFIMPLPEPSEFLGFGVLAPSNEVHFVARGNVLDHLGSFIARMEQAGARVELHARPPLEDAIVNEYVKGGPHEQKETEPPPPPPNFNEQLVRKEEPTTVYALSAVSSLWPANSPTRMIMVLPVPDSNDRLAFGLFEVNNANYFWGVSFVARLASGTSDFLDEQASDGIDVRHYNESPYRTLRDYIAQSFPGSLALAA